MFKTISLKVIRSPNKSFFRFRHVDPLNPYPPDFSKVGKVTICGAGSPTGQFLAYMLKKEEIIREIALHDDENVRGLALDLEHMNTPPKVRPNSGDFALKGALRNSDIVVITNGMEASLHENDCNYIRCNAALMYKYAIKVASICPEALICIITPPVNIMTSIFCDAMNACGVFNPKKVFGVCSLMEMRANTVVAEYLGLDPATVQVPIIGGATPSTMVPLLSHAKPYNEFSDAEIRQLVSCILNVPKQCKKYNTIAPMSTAYALCRFVLTLAAGLCNECVSLTTFIRADVVPEVSDEHFLCAAKPTLSESSISHLKKISFGKAKIKGYVHAPKSTRGNKKVKYFASKIRTSVMGAVENNGIPKLNDFELDMVSQVMVTLQEDENTACYLFSELHGDNRKEEIEENRKPRKPFIIKTPCPPCPPCLPTDVCQEKLPEDPCAATKNKLCNIFP